MAGPDQRLAAEAGLAAAARELPGAANGAS
jgi:hypothetical protein